MTDDGGAPRDPARDSTSNPWTTLRISEKYANKWIRVEEHDVLTPAGTPGIYGVIRPRGIAVGVLPLDAEGRATLVGQWRYPMARYSWEMPEGGGDKAVAPADTGRRELLEETGLVAARWHEILRMDLSNALSDEQAVCFLAWDLTQGTAQPEATEQLRLRRVPFAALLAEVLDGRITDSLTVATVLKADCLARRGALPEAAARLIRG